MMKAEMDDAFKVRKWVVVFLLATGVFAIFGALEFVRWLKHVLTWLRYVWIHWDTIGKAGPIAKNTGDGIMYGDR